MQGLCTHAPVGSQHGFLWGSWLSCLAEEESKVHLTQVTQLGRTEHSSTLRHQLALAE